jgi:O-acetylserine/cysteine efflux transporter
MTLDRRTAVAALTAAGLLWGTTVPVTKLALGWLPPGWLTVARFGLAAAVLLAAARFRVRAACSPAVLAWGALGYGGSILVQNAGVSRTSVSHAALLVGATPVLVAVIAALRHATVARPVAWTGFAVSFVGVGLVAAGGGGGATATGDGLVLASLVFSASFTVAQARLLPGRDPVAVTAVQFLAAALASLPVAAVAEGTPAAPAGADEPLAAVGLALVGTLAPATLFAYGQTRVAAEVAGAFINLEPLVGAAAGAVVFGDPVGAGQAAGGAAILTGIALSSLPLLRARGPGRRPRGLWTGARLDLRHRPPSRRSSSRSLRTRSRWAAGSVRAVADDRSQLGLGRAAVVVDDRGSRHRRRPQPVSDVEQPASDQHALCRHGDPRHLVAPVRLAATDRGELPAAAGWCRRRPAPPVGDRSPDASGPPQAVPGQVLLEGMLRGVADGDLVAPEQQRRLLGREQLGDEHRELLAQLADGRLCGRLAGRGRP